MINSDNKDKYQDYADVASHLKRQLETDANFGGILEGNMTLTELFFGIALGLSLAFGICFIILFYCIQYSLPSSKTKF